MKPPRLHLLPEFCRPLTANLLSRLLRHARFFVLIASLACGVMERAVAQEWITFYLRAELPYLEEPLTAEGSWVESIGTLYYSNSGSAELGPWMLNAEDTTFAATIWSGDHFALIDYAMVQAAAQSGWVHLSFQSAGPPWTVRFLLPAAFASDALVLAQQPEGSGPPFTSGLSITGQVWVEVPKP